MNGILVLAMVTPLSQSGTGPNFALPIGIVCGLFAMVCSMRAVSGYAWFLLVCLDCAPCGGHPGYGYGKLMNAVKGSR